MAPCDCSSSVTGSTSNHSRCYRSRQYIGDRTQLNWRSVRLPATSPAELVIGYGSAMFAIPLSLASGARRFFHCATRLSKLLARHDDFWISSYLKFEHGTSVSRVRFHLQGPNQSSRDLAAAKPTLLHTKHSPGRLLPNGVDPTALRDSVDLKAVQAACARHFHSLANCTSRSGRARSISLHSPKHDVD